MPVAAYALLDLDCILDLWVDRQLEVTNEEVPVHRLRGEPAYKPACLLLDCDHVARYGIDLVFDNDSLSVLGFYLRTE